jgi:phosphate transport system substrate-binding protein
MRRPPRLSLAAATLLVAAVGSACRAGDRETRAPDAGTAAASRTAQVDLTGAGATFPYPVYTRWISEYLTTSGVRVNYQSIGSGGGIRQLAEGTVDFGATDVPMSADELATARRGGVLHVPMVLGAVAVTYNLPELRAPLRLSPEVLADVFLGRVRRWDDPRLVALNPGVPLPSSDILVVHRGDGSGTTFIFSDYLATVSPTWLRGPGRGKDVRWPVGVGGIGNEGVAGQVKQTPGSIGYVEATYARQNRLPAAALRNRAGAYVMPTPQGIAAAAAAATAGLPPTTDYRVSLVDAPGAESYPVASFTWVLMDAVPRDTVKAAALVRFVRWALREGGPAAESLGYVPLPAPVAERVDARLVALPFADRAAPGGPR